MDFLTNLLQHFSSSSFLPHGHCFFWRKDLLMLTVGSDAIIALSYTIIPLTLLYFLANRTDAPYRFVFYLFVAFIFACGTTHVMDIVTIWKPEYWIAGFDKAATALISIVTALLLIKYIPEIIALPSRSAVSAANIVLEKSEAKFKGFLEGAPDAMVITSQDGKIEIVNAQAEKIFGYSKQEMIGEYVEFLIPVRYRNKHVDNRNHFYMNPHARPMGAELSLYGLRKDGNEFPVEICLSPVETEEGVHALAAIRDVTEKKNIEKLLIEKNLQLVNSDLAKDQFLTHMSHELRTPLNGIIVMTQMLMTDQLSPETKEKIEIISESNEQLLAVINQILDFSKVESGNIGVEQIDFNLREVMQKLTATYSVKSDVKNIKFDYRIDNNIPDHLIGDLVKLRQILTNLLDNAVKFTDQGTISVTVTADRKDELLIHLTFEVTDTGVGIPNDMQPKLFKPFSQGDSSMTRKYGGTGLGLAISKRLVEVMGGNIGVESSSFGSKFHFTIPFILQELKEKRSQENYSPVIDSVEYVSSKKNAGTILVVEDNKLNQRTLTMLLSKLDYTVVIANDGIEALKELGRRKFDMVLMDCQMPNMDGYKTTIQIRKMEAGTGDHIPIIGVTAHAMEGSREKCLEVGMDNYISKPYSIVDINKLIRKYLYQNSQSSGE